MTNPLFVILLALIVAFFLSEIFRYFNLPRVIGQILAGIILGLPMIRPYLFTVEVYSQFTFLTNMGILLLFFFIGLEISPKEFKKNFKESALISVFNTLIPLLAGFFAGRFVFGLSPMASLIIGISLSVSSQAISLDILEELKLIKSKIGNLIVSAGTVDDVFELLLVSFLLVAFHSAALGQSSFQKLAIDIFGFVLIVIIFRFSLIPIALRIFEREKSKSTLFMGALIIVLLMAYVSELLGVGSLIGALIAGILVRQTLLNEIDRKPWRMNEISHSIHIIAFGFLIPIFFVNVGLKTDFSSVSSNIPLILALLFIDIFGTVLGTIIGVILSKGTFREGLTVGFGVVPKGDTELAIATLALNAGIISIGVFTAIISVDLIATFIAPIVFKFLVKKYSTSKIKIIPKQRWSV
ncbi:MAG TPA: cation:proton antiporter [Candidatus Nanoarchaeia archaeon]|nr:cation:proton antiporter [Candidatus Nanoarchaeia archaeon]